MESPPLLEELVGFFRPPGFGGGRLLVEHFQAAVGGEVQGHLGELHVHAELGSRSSTVWESRLYTFRRVSGWVRLWLGSLTVSGRPG
jgi:hypothetical protein